MSRELTDQPLSADHIAAWIRTEIAALLEIDPSSVDPAAPFDDYGLASSDAVFLSSGLSDLVGFELSATLAWDFPSINELSDLLARVLRGEAELPDDAADWDIDADLLFE